LTVLRILIAYMQVKIDTREKFHVITFQEPHIAANMTEEMDKVLLTLLDDNVKNVIVNIQDTKIMDTAAAEHLIELQHQFYDMRASFVVCGLQPEVKKMLANADILDLLNYTPTESEAMDIVQMEEIERELGEI
jgi:anti-anti-sigma factor